jgi:hypothetical protein
MAYYACGNPLRALACIALVLALFVGGCKSPTAPEHEFGVLATFQVGPSHSERFTILITNEETIRQIKAFNKGQSDAGIPNGLVVRGAVSYNKPWSWHIDSEDIQMAEATAEINDGLPSFVEAELDVWAGGYYGPWTVRLISMEPVAAGLYR